MRNLGLGSAELSVSSPGCSWGVHIVHAVIRRKSSRSRLATASSAAVRHLTRPSKHLNG